MAVVLRLSRKGNKHRPTYKVVACDSRKKLNGAFLEQLGTYDPLGETALNLDVEAAQLWLNKGAQTSPTVKKLIRRARLQNAPVEAGGVAKV